MKKKKRTDRQIGIIVCCALLATTGCFSFPIWNFSKDFSASYTIFNLLIACFAYGEIGKLEKRLFTGKGRGVLLNLGLTLLGFACRYLLEFGEVSNVYNFTPVNLAVHLLAAILIPFLQHNKSAPKA